MKNFLMAVALVGAAVAAKGTAVAISQCSGDLTLAGIQAGPGGECEVGDKIFSAFTYTPGAGDPDAGHVTIGATQSGSTFGLQFGSNLTTITGAATAWLSNFTLGFTVTVDQTACQTLFPGSASCFISGTQDQFQGVQAGPTNTATFSGSHTLGGTISLNALLTANETGQITGLNQTSMVDVFTGGASASFPVNQFGTEVFQGQVPTVPEPMTLSLMGVGLVGLGLLRKRIGRS